MVQAFPWASVRVWPAPVITLQLGDGPVVPSALPPVDVALAPLPEVLAEVLAEVVLDAAWPPPLVPGPPVVVSTPVVVADRAPVVVATWLAPEELATALPLLVATPLPEVLPGPLGDAPQPQTHRTAEMARMGRMKPPRTELTLPEVVCRPPSGSAQPRPLPPTARHCDELTRYHSLPSIPKEPWIEWFHCAVLAWVCGLAPPLEVK